MRGLFLEFLLEPLTEPLLDHALVIEVAAAGDALDAGEHAGVEAESDGGAFPDIGAMHGHLHEAGVDLVPGPEGAFVVVGFKGGHVLPETN